MMDVMNAERIPGRRTAMGEYIPEPGGRPLTLLAEPYPGPADYDPDTRLIKPSAPKYSVQGKHEPPLPKAAEVSPADFDTGGDLVWKTRSIHVKSKGETQPYDIRRKGHLTAGVGPSRYKVDNLGIGTEGPRYAVGARYKEGVQTGPPNALVQPVDTLGVSTPGPTYKPRSERGNKISIGLPAKEAIVEGPGPADYETREREPPGPVYSIATRVPPAGYDKQPIIPDNPGPKYDVGTTIGKAPAFSVKSRHIMKTRDFAPGPNQYTLPDTLGDGPNAILTYKPFEFDQRPHPGPADYTINDKTLKKSPTHAFGKRTKPNYPDVLHYPAAGYYNPAPCDYSHATKGTVRENDGPKYTMGRRVKQTINDNPGPNKYNVTDPRSTRKAPQFTIGRRLHRKEADDSGPGPAAYFPKIPQSKQGFSITKKPAKPIAPGELTPGSNVYNIKRNLTNKGEVTGPKFSLRSRHSPFVYSGFRNINLIRG